MLDSHWRAHLAAIGREDIEDMALSKPSFNTLMRRLSQAGFKRSFVEQAILPDWWDSDCVADPSLLQDVEIRVARFLEQPISLVKNYQSPLIPPGYPLAQLRRVRDLDRDKLGPAIHTAMAVANAVIRSLNLHHTPAAIPTIDPLAWRKSISCTGKITLRDMVQDLWNRGIPVILLKDIPTPSFQGLACIASGRPAILLGQKHDEPSRLAFIVAHEVAHIAAGDCTPDQPIVDSDDAMPDSGDIEVRADQFARQLLLGSNRIPKISGATYESLATEAHQIESTLGADAGTVIYAWARDSGEYAKATMAIKALYRHVGARRILAESFSKNLDLSEAPESDRLLLRCIEQAE